MVDLEAAIRDLRDLHLSDEAVIDACVAVGEAAVPELARVLLHRRERVSARAMAAFARLDRTLAVDALVELGAAAIAPLHAALGQATPVALLAVEALAHIPCAERVGALTEALVHPHPEVRRRAAVMLGEIGDPAAFPALAVLLDRNGAAHSRYQRDDADTLESRNDVVIAAAYAMGRMRRPQAVRELEILLQHDTWRVRLAAIEALGHLGGAGAARVLCQDLVASDELPDADGHRAWVVKALIQVGQPAVSLLAGAMEIASPRGQWWIIHALRQISDATAIDALHRALFDAERPVRREAGAALVELGWMPLAPSQQVLYALAVDDDALLRRLGTSGLEWLSELLFHHPPSMRCDAIAALGRLGAREALPMLRRRLRRWRGEGDREVRALIAEAVLQIEAATEATAGLPRPADGPAPHARPRAGDNRPHPRGRPRVE